MIRQVLRSGLYQCVVHYFQRAPPPNQTTRPTAAALQVMPLYRTHYMQIILRALHPFLFSQYGDIIGKEVSLVLVWIPLVAPPTLKLWPAGSVGDRSQQWRKRKSRFSVPATKESSSHPLSKIISQSWNGEPHPSTIWLHQWSKVFS